MVNKSNNKSDKNVSIKSNPKIIKDNDNKQEIEGNGIDNTNKYVE
mgnify:CR=1 FL=1